MKSEQRHKMQTNYLADRLGHSIDSARPVAGLVLGGLAAVAVAAIGYGVYSSLTQRANSEAWTEYYLNVGSGDAEAFNTVVELFPSSSAAPWARQMMGDNQLLRGIEALYRNRAEGEQSIKEAIDSYKAVIESTHEPELRGKASIGLAQAYESLGKIDDALKFYQDVEKSGVQPSLVQMAAERAAWLRTEPSKKFYDWFATLKTTPDAPPTLPSNLNALPTSPDISFPIIQQSGAVAPLGTNAAAETKSAEVSQPANAPIVGTSGTPALPPSIAPPALELPGSTVPPAPAAKTSPSESSQSEPPATSVPAPVESPPVETPLAPKP